MTKRTYEPREFTNHIIKQIEEDPGTDLLEIIISLLSYLSDDEAYDWAISNGYIDPEEFED